MARAILVGPKDEGRAPYQVALMKCEDCGRAFQQAHGEDVEVPPEVLERAECDAQHLGRIGHENGSSHVGRPFERATQTIPPATRRAVMRRDRGRCRVPSCRNTVFLDVHHLWLRSEGGPNHPSNLCVLCGLCRARHKAHYADSLIMPRGPSETSKSRAIERTYAA